MDSGACKINDAFLSKEEVSHFLDQIKESDWTFTHPDGMYQNNAWRVIKLISKGEKTKDFFRFRGIPELADRFKCPIKEMLFYSILPGGVLHPHIDVSGTLELGWVRFHIPLVTNPGVNFQVDRKRVPMMPGELWALNTSYLHAVSNLGDHDRIHMVFEVEANSWVRGLLPPRTWRYYRHAAYFFLQVAYRAAYSFIVDWKKIPGRLTLAKMMFVQIFKRKPASR